MSIRSNAAEHIGRLGLLQQQAPVILADAIVAASYDALPALEDATPVDSGALRDAWTVYPTATGAVIDNPLPYATNRGPDPADFFHPNLVAAAVDARIARLLE